MDTLPEEIEEDVPAVEPEDTTPEPDTIRESLNAALAEQAAEPEPVKEDRARDETGKFAKKEEAAAETPAPDKVSSEADKPADGVPSSWNAQGRELFAKAPPELQEYIRTREGQMQEGVAKLKQDLGGKAEFADTMWREIAPYEQMIKSEGGNPAGAVRDLLHMAALMRTGTPDQKRQLLLNTAQQFKVDLSGAAQPQQGQPQPAHDPRIDHLAQTIQAIEARDQQQMTQRLKSDIEKFAEAHPHFESVRVEMGKLIKAGVATDMKEAYEKAIWATPGTRERLQAEANEKLAKDREAKAKAAADKARQASGSVTGAPGLAGNGQTMAPASSIRAELERLVDASRA